MMIQGLTEEIDRFRVSAGINYEITSVEELLTEVATLAAQTSLTTFTLLVGLLLNPARECVPDYRHDGGRLDAGAAQRMASALVRTFSAPGLVLTILT